MYKTLYIPEMLSKTPECIAEKLVTYSFSVFFFKLYEKLLHLKGMIENCYI